MGEKYFDKITMKQMQGNNGCRPVTSVLAEEKFAFQRPISAVVSEHDILASFAVNVNQILLSYNAYA